jgi:hypothetical protein
MFEATLEEWFSIYSLDQWKDAEAEKIARWADVRSELRPK